MVDVDFKLEATAAFAPPSSDGLTEEDRKRLGIERSERVRADVTKRTTVCEARFEDGIRVSYGHVVAALERV